MERIGTKGTSHVKKTKMESTLVEVLKSLFDRDLRKLGMEIGLYQNENNIWQTAPGISNSGGNLCLHLIGNLNAYIAAEFGKTGYVRNREQEFSLKNMQKSALLRMIDKTASAVENALDQITAEDLKKDYPRLVFDKKTTTEYFLVHLATHLTYHPGQINYHRRLLEG